MTVLREAAEILAGALIDPQEDNKRTKGASLRDLVEKTERICNQKPCECLINPQKAN